MDIAERSNDFAELLRVALDGRQSRVWTALPGIVQSFDPKAMTCQVQPTIQMRVTDKNYVTTLKTFPLLVDCPVCFPSGGGCLLSFPLTSGDECLVVFGSRGIDYWWQQGGVQPPAQARMHDLSDGFVIPGPFSQPRVPAASPSARGLSATATELRSTDGSTSISLDAAGQIISISAPGGIAITGNITVTGDVVANGISLVTHTHGEVQSGADETGPPTP